MSVWSLGSLDQHRNEQRKLYLEFLRQPSMSAGLYVLEAGSEDPQQPHTEDEIYVVLDGQAQIRIGDQDFAIKPGDSIFVPALMPHRFHTIRQTLRVIVVFAPAEYARRAS
jgi:mannose-6-phosphate isomerase-like protein (cupin superfamily)